MILRCKVHCWSMPEDEAEDLNINDPGSWLKSAFDLRQVKAIKHAVDEITDPLYYCTTLYFIGGDSFTIDVPYDTVFDLWQKSLGIPVHQVTDKELDF